MIITSRILSDHKNIIHGISTRYPDEPTFFNNLSKHVGDNIDTVMKNRKRFFGLLGISTVSPAHANQVHSDGVSIVSTPGLYPETDALITSDKDLQLIISVADCMPVMIYDPSKKVIANIHSGWRGTQKKITGKVIGIMARRFGCSTNDMLVFMGPAISKKNFEVHEDVANMFSPSYSEPKPGSPGKFLVDTAKAVYDSLTGCGIARENIEQNPLCTFDEDKLLHSYRRDGSQSGRMFAVLGLK